MGKTVRFNFAYLRVEIDPPISNDAFNWRRDARTISQDIRRHVDCIKDVKIIDDTDAFCEHCGYCWTENSNDYNGGCCEKDLANVEVDDG